MHHVVEEQVPLLSGRSLEPQLITCMIGTNDFIGGSSAGRLEADATRLADHLPAGTWLGRGGGPGRKRSAAFRKPLDAALACHLERQGIDACGENGEFHTLAVDGPLFRRPLVLCPGRQVRRADCWFQDLCVEDGSLASPVPDRNGS